MRNMRLKLWRPMIQIGQTVFTYEVYNDYWLLYTGVRGNGGDIRGKQMADPPIRRFEGPSLANYKDEYVFMSGGQSINPR